MLQKVRDILETTDTAGPVPEEQIRRAEELLELRFPAAYREFLATYGAAMGMGWEIYGIDSQRVSEDAPPLFVDVVQTAIRHRSGYHGQFHPPHLIEIAHDGMELGFYLDLSSVSCGDCPVVALGPGVDLLQASPTLVDFLVGWSRDQLANLPEMQA